MKKWLSQSLNLNWSWQKALVLFGLFILGAVFDGTRSGSFCFLVLWISQFLIRRLIIEDCSRREILFWWTLLSLVILILVFSILLKQKLLV